MDNLGVRAAIVLKVNKDVAIAALKKLIETGEQLLDRNPLDFYIPDAQWDQIGRNPGIVSGAAQIRQGAITWYQEVQIVCKDLFDKFSIPESVLVGHNKMFPKVSVLRELLARVETDAVSSAYASVVSTHPDIVSRCHHNFEAGHFHDAVFDAFKALENAIRDRIGAPMDEVGMTLIKLAMNPAKPRLCFSPVAAEQEAVYQLYRGALGTLKNPLSHRFLEQIDEVSAAESIAVASFLRRLLEQAKLQSPSGP